MRWFRWYHGTCTLPKMGSLARRAGTTRERVIAVWAMLLESASKTEDGGRYTIDADGIADCLNCETESVESVLAAMESRAMIAGGVVLDWEEWQKPVDSSADRVRRYRAKKAADDVTDVTVTVTPPEKEEEREVEEETTSVLKLHTDARDVEGQINEVMRAANRGMLDNPEIGERTNPIPVSHGSREEVRGWLDLAPLEVVRRAVYNRAKAYKPTGPRRQITTMAYFAGAVQDDVEIWKASQLKVSDEPQRATQRGTGTDGRGADRAAPAGMGGPQRQPPTSGRYQFKYE